MIDKSHATIILEAAVDGGDAKMMCFAVLAHPASEALDKHTLLRMFDIGLGQTKPEQNCASHIEQIATCVLNLDRGAQ